MTTSGSKSRRLVLPDPWTDMIGLELSPITKELLVSHPRSTKAFVYTEGRSQPTKTISVPGHVDLKVADDSHASFIYGDRQRAALLAVGPGTISVETPLPFPATSAVSISSEWVMSRFQGEKLFHRLSQSGEVLGSFGTGDSADKSPFKSWAGEIQRAVTMGGKLGRLSATAFVFAYDALPLVEAYDIGGRRLWSTALDQPAGRTPDAKWKDIQERNPGMKVAQGMIFPLNTALAVGHRIAILHQPPDGTGDRTLSLLDASGSRLGTVSVGRDVIAVVWRAKRLLGARAKGPSELMLEQLSIG